jgi:hypothetical protein
LLLPHVSITNVKSFQLPTGGNSTIANAIGMVVYNTNPALGEGLYTWNGTEWKSVGSGSSGNCTPVTATSSSSKTGSNTTLKVEVSAGTPAFTYTWYKSGVNGSIRTVSNATATNDTYTTAAAGTYTCQVVNTCTTTPASFTFIIGADGSSDSYVDNGNGTYTDNDGNLVVIDEDGTKEVYTSVKSDIPGVYLDKDGEIVYTGADGIPGTEDDNVFVVPTFDAPRPKPETLFSLQYPFTYLVRNEEYQIQLDFANPPYSGQIKYLSSVPTLCSADENGLMKTPLDGTFVLAVILEDGSAIYKTYSIANSRINPLTGIIDTEVNVAKNSVTRLSASYIAEDGSVNATHIKSLTYKIEQGNDDGTGSTITPGGWFHAGGTSGTILVTATAVNGSDQTITGTIQVNIPGDPSPEGQPYATTSTNWATLDAAPAYAGGDGSQDNPFQISSVRQLKKLSIDVDLLDVTEVTYQKYFELTTDLDFFGDETVTKTLISTFYGTLDGKGHVIKNLTIDVTGKAGITVFGNVSYGEIKNLGREGGSTFDEGASSTAAVGGLVTSLGNGGKLTNCYNSASILNVYRAGGLVFSTSGTAIIENCYNKGKIESKQYTGGLIGTILNSGGTLTVINSYNSGNVEGKEPSTSGFLGAFNSPNGYQQILNMTNCFNFGDVTVPVTANYYYGSIIGAFSNPNITFTKINATNVYSRLGVLSVGGETVSNQPLGWYSTSTAITNGKDAVLEANPTFREDAKYTLDYGQSAAFATELGSAFKYASGRTPKLAWEQ